MRVLFLLLLLLGSLHGEAPNVLLIVADDLGYHDLGFQGSKEVQTPHLDKLAAGAVRCTQGYVPQCFCSPTRAGLLTGRYPHRFGHEGNPAWLPNSTTSGLSLAETPFPQHLRKLGYHTGAVGKWHLGAHPQFHPMQRGFDEYFGALGGGHMYFPEIKGSIEYTIPLDRNGKSEPPQGYLTDQFGEEAAAFIKRRADQKVPWMLYLAFNAPHTPLQAPEETIQKLAHVENKHRRTYLAMVMAMDAAIGKALLALEATAQAENTIVFFISDNGGPDLSRSLGVNFTDNQPLRGSKGTFYEGGIRVPFLIRWPAQLKPGVYDSFVSALDFLPTTLAAAGRNSPAEKPLDGVNLLPYLKGEISTPPHERLFWRSGGPGGQYAAREASWKLVRTGKNPSELYDLSLDTSEKQNLASAHPDVVQHLEKAIVEWEKGTQPPAFQNPKGAAKAAKAKKTAP